MIGFEIEPGEEVETDMSHPTGFQKVARFTDDGSQLVTAGADGHFRVWKVWLICWGFWSVVAVVRFKARYNNNNNNITYVTMRTVFVFFGKFKKKCYFHC